MKPLSQAWRHWYLRVFPAYWLFLTFTTHVPNLELRGAPPESDKALHLGAFGLLAFLCWRFREALSGPIGPIFAPAAAVGLLAYAGIDEYTQQFVRRSTDWADWLANATGILLVLAGMEVRRRWASRRTNPTRPAKRAAE